ncbi:MAG TPA: hypothetical protein VGC18_04625 [Lacisediminihabitans sp.]|uniref:hypothetical protein n=1 Tax=Lacisediminihabitans sp. TaxID=2787631 RepID=UPI002ED7C263
MLDTEVDLKSTSAKPAPSARSQDRRLLQFIEAEDVSPELLATVLSARWNRQLDVVQSKESPRRCVVHVFDLSSQVLVLNVSLTPAFTEGGDGVAL